MKLIEKTALNEILRTVTYIAEKVDAIDRRLNQLEIKDSASSASKSATIK